MAELVALSSAIRTISRTESNLDSPVDEKEGSFNEKPIQDAEAAHDGEFEITEEDRKAERRLVWRLDIFVLIIGFVGYAMKYLDQVSFFSSRPGLQKRRDRDLTRPLSRSTSQTPTSLVRPFLPPNRQTSLIIHVLSFL